MPITQRKFLAEVSPAFKVLYLKHRASRADYKQAVERLSVKKMPRATEADRRRFVGFALNVYDLMKRSGFSPDTPVVEMGRRLAEAVKKN